MEIEYLGIKMDVVFSFDRQESQTQNYVGSADSVEINEIKIKDLDVYDLFSSNQLTEIEDIIIKQFRYAHYE